MSLISFVPLPINQEAFSAAVNNGFAPCYTLVNGLLDSSNFGVLGLNPSQFNAGTIANNGIALQFGGGVSVSGGNGLTVTPTSTTTGTSDIILNYLGFVGTYKAQIDYNSYAASAVAMHSLNSSFPAPALAYTNSVVGGFGSLPALLTTAGATGANTAHMVVGSGTTTSSGESTLSVTLSNSAAFTSSSSYVVICSGPATASSEGPYAVEYTSGSVFKIHCGTYTNSSSIYWIAIGT